MFKRHPLVRTLLSLQGNPKSCVLTEAMWGIPYNLYAPYVSVYMLALGLKDSQIGLLVTISFAFQILGAILGGAITDKLGRRKTTAIFDFVSWSIPTFIWAISQNFGYFVAAAIFNGVWRVTHTSWSCLMVEDANPDQLIDIYSWINIAGLLSAFFAPLAGLLINRFTLVPTMRGLYLFACVMMTAKFLILYFTSTETKQGRVRMEETKNQSLISLVGGYGGIFNQILHTPRTLYALGILVVMNLATTISNTFWSIIVTQKIRIPAGQLALYPFARSIIMLFFFFLAMPRLKEMRFRNPMMVGFALLAVSQVILIVIPEKSYLLLLASTLLEACSFATVSTQVDRMTVVTIDAQERARIMSMMFLVVIIVTTPFGFIAGKLSEINRILPFVFDIALYATGIVLVFLAARHPSNQAEPEKSEPVEAAV